MNNHINSRSKKRKKSGLEEKLTKIFKERFSVSLKKNNSKGKEPYMKTGVHIGAYSINKSKSPTSYSHEKGEVNSANYKIYGMNGMNGINSKKIKQNYIIGITDITFFVFFVDFINTLIKNSEIIIIILSILII